MNDSKKRAYRSLLYYVITDIRVICWDQSLIDPIPEPLKQIEYLVDWVHNLAAFSASDFEKFNEEWFWQDGPGVNVTHYRKQFNEILSRYEGLNSEKEIIRPSD